MNNLTILVFFIAICIGHTNAQQLPLYSQYLNNEFIINPAFTGNTGESTIQIGYRNQWTGFKGAPSMVTLGGQTNISNKNMGIGGLLFANNTGGAIKQTGGMLNYSYFVKVNSLSRFAFGLSAVFNQYSYDASSIQALNTSDVSLFTSTKAFVPDINLGIAFINNDLKIGLAVDQLFQTRIKSWNALNMQISSQNQLVNHYNFSISNKYQLNNSVEMEPYFVTRNISKNTFQFDLGSRFTYNKKIFGSIAYRLKDAFIFVVGIKHNNLSFSYSYDLTTSLLRQYSYGSHEIFLRYHIIRKQNFRSLINRTR